MRSIRDHLREDGVDLVINIDNQKKLEEALEPAILVVRSVYQTALLVIKNGPPYKEVSSISNTEEKTSSSSSAVKGTPLVKAEDEEEASPSHFSSPPESPQPNGHTEEIELAPPTYEEFRSLYPPARLDDSKARPAFMKLPPVARVQCVFGLKSHLTCERWIRSPRYIPLASNFIGRTEYLAVPPPYLSLAPDPAADRDAARAKVNADRARRIFEDALKQEGIK